MCLAETQVMFSPLCYVCKHIKLSDVSLRTRSRYSLVSDEDVKKQTHKLKADPKATDWIAFLSPFSFQVQTMTHIVVFKKCRKRKRMTLFISLTMLVNNIRVTFFWGKWDCETIDRISHIAKIVQGSINYIYLIAQGKSWRKPIVPDHISVTDLQTAKGE